MVICAPLSLVLSTLYKRNKVKALSWESGSRLRRSQVGGNLLPQIALLKEKRSGF